MASRRATSKRGRSHWTVANAREVLAAWENSGMSVAAFCRQRGLRPKRVYWWRQRLSEWSGDGEDGHHDLVEAMVTSRPPATNAAAVVQLHLQSGDRVEVELAVAPAADWLIRLVQGLDRR